MRPAGKAKMEDHYRTLWPYYKNITLCRRVYIQTDMVYNYTSVIRKKKKTYAVIELTT